MAVKNKTVIARALKEMIKDKDKAMKSRSSTNDSALIDSLITSVSKPEKADLYKEAGIFDRDLLSRLTSKQLHAIADMVSAIDTLSKMKTAPTAGSSNAEMASGLAVQQVIDNYTEALTETSKVFESYAIMSPMSPQNLGQLFDGLDNGRAVHSTDSVVGRVPSKTDLEIVRALKMCGIDLRLEHGKWEIDSMKPLTLDKNDPNGTVVFKKEQVQNLLDGYLNPAPKDRQIKVSAESVINTFFAQAREALHLKAGSLPEEGRHAQEVSWLTELVNLKKHMGPESEEWMVASLTDPHNIRVMAQKTALQDIFKEQCNAFTGDPQKAKDPILSDDLAARVYGFGFNTDNVFGAGLLNRARAFIGSRSVMGKLFTNLEEVAENASDQVNETMLDFTSFENYSQRYDALIKKYETQKENMEKGGSSADLSSIEEKIDSLKQAKTVFESTVEFQKSYIQHEMEGCSPKELPNKILIASSQSANSYRVVMENGELKLEGDNMSTEVEQLFKAIKDKYAPTATAGNNGATTVNGDNTFPNIAFEFVNMLSGDATFMANLSDYVRLEICEQFFQEGEPLDVRFKAFMADPNNAGKNIDDFIDSIEPKDPSKQFFGKDVLKSAYLKKMGTKVEDMPKENSEFVTRAEQNFTNTMVYMDRVLKALTPEEIASLDSMPPAQREQLYKDKFEKIKNIPITDTEKVEATSRHRDGALAHILVRSGTVREMLDFEKESIGEEKLDSKVLNNGFTASLDKYVQALINGQDAKNKTLLNDGKPIVKYDDPRNVKAKTQAQDTPENEDENEKNNLRKFDELYPSSPDSDLFHKKMKPFPGKEVAKQFLKPLLKAIANTKVDVSKMKERNNVKVQQPTAGLDPSQVDPNGANNTADPQQNQVPEPDEQTVRSLIDAETSRLLQEKAKEIGGLSRQDPNYRAYYEEARKQAEANKDQLIADWKQKKAKELAEKAKAEQQSTATAEPENEQEIVVPEPDAQTVRRLVENEAKRLFEEKSRYMGGITSGNPNYNQYQEDARRQAEASKDQLIEKWKAERLAWLTERKKAEQAKAQQEAEAQTQEKPSDAPANNGPEVIEADDFLERVRQQGEQQKGQPQTQQPQGQQQTQQPQGPQQNQPQNGQEPGLFDDLMPKEDSPNGQQPQNGQEPGLFDDLLPKQDNKWNPTMHDDGQVYSEFPIYGQDQTNPDAVVSEDQEKYDAIRTAIANWQTAHPDESLQTLAKKITNTPEYKMDSFSIYVDFTLITGKIQVNVDECIESVLRGEMQAPKLLQDILYKYVVDLNKSKTQSADEPIELDDDEVTM